MSDAGQRANETVVFESRELGKNFELVLPEAVTTLHVDGIAGVGLTGAFGRIEFFLTEGMNPDADHPELGIREKRVIRIRVNMPSPQLIEGLLNIVELIQPQAEQFQAGTKAQNELMAKQIARLKETKIGTP